MAIDASSPADRVDQLIRLSEELIEAAREEIALIEARQPPPGEAQLERKMKLANAYRMEMARIQQDPSLIITAPPAALARLKSLAASLREISAAHVRAVEAVKTVSEGLLQALAEEAARQRSHGLPYGPGGGAPAGARGAVALDRRA